jgi:hypothetical protein
LLEGISQTSALQCTPSDSEHRVNEYSAVGMTFQDTFLDILTVPRQGVDAKEKAEISLEQVELKWQLIPLVPA